MHVSSLGFKYDQRIQGLPQINIMERIKLQNKKTLYQVLVPYLSLVSGQADLSKQGRARTDTSALFATHPAVSQTHQHVAK